MLNIDEYRQIRKDYFNENFYEASDNYYKYKVHKMKRAKEKYCIDPDCRGCDVERSPKLVEAMEFATKCLPLAPLPTAVPVCQPKQSRHSCWVIDDCIKEEGKIPMRYNDNYASASVQTVTPKSDAQVGREYLLNRLDVASYPKCSSFEKMFNLHISNEPKNFQELIDRIKNDKFKINKKVQRQLDALKADADEAGADSFPWYHGWSYGIEWDGPKADLAGYEQALTDRNAEQTKARDVIMTSDNAAGLKALQDFEAWLPTPATTIQ